MDVSFKGINSVKICKDKQLNKTWGYFPSVLGDVKQGEQYYRDYKLYFKLTNEPVKADFDEFLSEMAKANIEFKTSYFKGFPNKIELFMRRYEVPNDIITDSVYSLFKINGQDIPILNSLGLGLYTKLAEITRRIMSMTNITPTQKECIQLFNQEIAREAERFIEIM